METDLPEAIRAELSGFWTLVTEVWNQGVFGVDIGRLLVAGVIVIGFLAFRKLFSAIVISRLRKAANGTETQIDDAIVDALAGPLKMIFVILGLYFASQYLGLTGDLEALLGRVMRSLIAFTIFYALYNSVTNFSRLFRNLERVLTAEMVDWLVKAVRAAIVLIGLGTILEIWGIQVGPLIAGLGLFGVAVALGAQDLFKNLISGLLILAEKRFQKGDWVLVDGVVEGTVEHIGFRSTFVRRFDKAPVFVPNSRLSDSAVTNFSRMTHRRIYWKIGVEYRTSIDQLRQIRNEIEAYVMRDPEFAKPPSASTFVRIDSFGPSAIDIMLYCFTVTTSWGEWLEIKERLAYRIKEIVEGAGTSFAFPSQSLYVETLPADRPETYIPPETLNPQRQEPSA